MTGALPGLGLHYEWESGDGVRAPELAATWARLEISVGRDFLTLVEETSSRSSRRSIYGSLYPLAEWIAFNWWQLLADERTALRFDGAHHAAVPRRFGIHNMRSAGDGFLWPDVTFIPQGSRTRVRWNHDRDSVEGHPIRYLSSGQATIDSDDFKRTLVDLVESVLGRLDDAGVGPTALASEWRAITNAGDSQGFCLAAASMGLDPYATDAELDARIVAVGDQLSPDLHADFFPAVTPHTLEDALAWMNRAETIISTATNPASLQLEAVQSAIGGYSAALPWREGFEQARLARSKLGYGNLDRIRPDHLVNAQVLPLAEHSIQGMAGTSAKRANALVVGRQLRPSTERFAGARALWHVSSQPDAAQLLTASHSVHQQIGRSFAAEFLAPCEGIHEFLARDDGEDGIVALEDMESAADHFGVSPLVIQHQINNQFDAVSGAAFI